MHENIEKNNFIKIVFVSLSINRAKIVFFDVFMHFELR